MKARQSFDARFSRSGLGWNPSGWVAVLGLAAFFALAASAAAATPAVTIEEPSQVTGSSAHFAGTIDPEGTDEASNVFWRFECTPECPGAGSGGVIEAAQAGNDPQDVAFDPTGLAPNTSYEVRLIAENASAESASAGPESFTTDKVAPGVEARWAGSVDTGSAVIAAAVNPHNSPATYQFEWGTSTGYGQVTPATPTPLGASDNQLHVVTASLPGLQEGATYHYRLVATNSDTGAVTVGADRSFTTLAVAGPPSPCANERFRSGFGALLPDCRAYEQVSPTNKVAYDVGTGGTGENTRGGPVAPDGSAAIFLANGPFEGLEMGGLQQMVYSARRSETGWTTTPMMRRIPDLACCPPSYNMISNSPDLGKSLIEIIKNPNGATAFYYYVRDNRTGSLDFAFVTSSAIGDGTLTPDETHFIFASQTPLSSEAPPVEGFIVYDFDLSNGQLSLVSRQPGDDAPFLESSVIGGGDTFPIIYRAVSDDSSKLFFSSPARVAFPTKIYRRDSGGTVLASPSKRSSPDPSGERAKFFEAASTDGNRVFFRSCERLTDDANDPAGNCFSEEGDLYRYDLGDDQLIDLSAATPGSEAAHVKGVLDISAEGDRAYFAAGSSLTPDAPPSAQQCTSTLNVSAVAGCNLYVWSDDGTAHGTLRFIATLDAATRNSSGMTYTDDQNWNWALPDKTGQASADGRYLAFQSRAQLTSNAPTGTSQVYVYDAEAAGGAGELTCVSCGRSTDPPAGNSFMASFADNEEFGNDSVSPNAYPQTISADGEIIFSTPDALVPRDSNGLYDAYLWKDGRSQLLSTGSSDDDSYAYGISANGDDAFFRTRQQLVPQDGDFLVDLYTAHVGGGFLSQQELVPLDCEGEACHGAGSQPPAAQNPVTSSFQGVGNEKTRRCPKGKRKVRRHGKVRCVRRHTKKHHKGKSHHKGRRAASQGKGAGK